MVTPAAAAGVSVPLVVVAADRAGRALARSCLQWTAARRRWSPARRSASVLRLGRAAPGARPGWSRRCRCSRSPAYALLAVDVSARAGGVTGDLRTLALDAARNAVPRLLTALIPVEPQPDTVLGPVVLAWLAGFAGAELAARARRPALALLPPTLLYAGALVLVGPNADVVRLAAARLRRPGRRSGWSPASATSGARGLPGLESGRARRRCGCGPRRAWPSACSPSLAVVAVVAPLVARTVVGAPTDPRRYVAAAEPRRARPEPAHPDLRLGGQPGAAPVRRRRSSRGGEPARGRPRAPRRPRAAPTGDPSVVAAPTDEPDAGAAGRGRTGRRRRLRHPAAAGRPVRLGRRHLARRRRLPQRRAGCCRPSRAPPGPRSPAAPTAPPPLTDRGADHRGGAAGPAAAGGVGTAPGGRSAGRLRPVDRARCSTPRRSRPGCSTR